MRETQQKLKGVGEQIQGKAREIKGAVTGETSEQVRGKFEQMKGKGRRAVADLAQDVEDETGARI